MEDLSESFALEEDIISLLNLEGPLFSLENIQPSVSQHNSTTEFLTANLLREGNPDTTEKCLSTSTAETSSPKRKRERRQCPFCKKEKLYANIVDHVTRAHGMVSGEERARELSKYYPDMYTKKVVQTNRKPRQAKGTPKIADIISNFKQKI